MRTINWTVYKSGKRGFVLSGSVTSTLEQSPRQITEIRNNINQQLQTNFRDIDWKLVYHTGTTLSFINSATDSNQYQYTAYLTIIDEYTSPDYPNINIED